MPADDAASAVGDAARSLAEAADLGGPVGLPVRPRPARGQPSLAPSASMRCSGIRHSFGCAWRGVLSTVASQRNMRIQGCVAALVTVAGLLLRLQPLEWAAIAICSAMVFVAEITNTAIEAVVDQASPGYSELARVAKDAAAGAVLVASAASVIVGLLVLGPHLLALLR